MSGSVLDAAYWTGSDYPGGAKALAERINHRNLDDELNPNRTSAKLGLKTAVDMQVMSGDFRILYAMAEACRHFPPVPMPDVPTADAPCLATLSRLAHEFSSLVGEVAGDLGDNKVTNAELAEIVRRWHALVSCGQVLIQQVTAMNAALQALAPEARP
ncbi:phage regulatory CII family protein [Roseateles asaccharophilus]|uniref:Uncharacterized protein n=1 Tax=Roseateles asaccharophilus TaxID=582607 RepID=A0ABU2A3Y1_9BURK|nr:phage regulatory CII family protein [Roseateles asaccharophilus]MDR7331745.1 hypothetical protein [Roseateles asaccharophilus]